MIRLPNLRMCSLVITWVCSLSSAQVVHIGASAVSKRVYVSNAVFQTNTTGHYEQPALARVLLETYRADPNLNPVDAIAQMNKLRDEFNQAPKPPGDFVTMRGAVDTLFELGSSLPGPYGTGAKVAKVAFDQVANQEEQQLTTDARIFSSLNGAATYADIQQTQDSTWDQLYDEARSNPNLGRAVSAVFSTSLKANVGDSADEIMKANPAFSDHADIVFLRSHLTNGQLDIDPTQLSPQAAQDISAALSVLNTQRGLLRDLEKGQSSLIAYVKNDAAQRAAQAEAEKQWQMDQLKLGAAQAGVNLLSGFAHLAHDDRAAALISTTGTATIQIATAIGQYSKTVASLGSDASGLGAAVLTGNVASAVFQVIGVLGASGPSTDQVILKQLADLRKDIKDLHDDMSSRFDQVDKRLNQLADEVDLRFNYVDLNLGTIILNDQQILSDLTSLQLQMQALQVLTTSIAQQEARSALAHKMDDILFFKSRKRATPSRHDFEDAESYLYTYAVRDSTTTIFQPVDGRDSSAFGIGDALASYSNYENLSFYLRYLHATYPVATSDWTATSVVNPYDWSEGAAAYVELCKEMLPYHRKCDTGRLSNVLAAGNTARTALKQLILKSDDLANKELLNALVASYQSRLDALSKAVDSDISDQLSNLNLSPTMDTKKANGALDLWAGSSQTTAYAPTFSKVETCPHSGHFDYAMSLSPAPDNAGSKVPNTYRLAEQLGLGSVEFCLPVQAGINQYIGGGWITTTPTIIYDFNFHATESFLVDEVLMASTAVPQLPPTYGVDLFQKWSNFVTPNWSNNLNLRGLYTTGQFESDVYKSIPDANRSPVQKAVLDSFNKNEKTVRSRIDQKMLALQQACYTQVITDLATGKLRNLSEQLYGAKQVLIQYAALGVPSSTNDDDMLRALLFGEESILGGDDVARLFQESLRDAVVGQNITKVDITKTAKERLDLLSTRLANIVELTANKKVEQQYRLLDGALDKFSVQ